MFSRPSMYTNVPDIVAGYPINGEWEVVVPIGRANEVLNPSLETNLTGYTAGAGSLVRSTTKQYHGVYSAAYTPSAALTDGFYYSFTTNWTAGTFRAISCKFLGQQNVPYILSVNTNVGVELQAYRFRATGRWQWIWLYWLETSTTNRRIYFRKDNSNDTHVFYVDGVQSEIINTGELVSTYIDGDQQGFLPNQSPPAYYWVGTPHASVSTRTVLTRAGGYIVPFRRYGFLLMSIIGLGLAAPQNVTTEYSLIDGGNPTYTRKPTSQFNIVGNVSGNTYRSLRWARSALGQFLDRDASSLDQPLLLRYRHKDNCDNVQSDTVTVPCKYVSGWEGQSTNHAAQAVTMAFETYLPSVTLDREAGGTLGVQTSVTNADYIIARTAAGAWQNMGSAGANGVVRAIAVAPNGDVYVGGDFTDFGGSGADYIARWNGTSWNTVGGATALNNGVYALAFGPSGLLYVGGAFTNAGGNANADRIATWDGATWGNLSTGAPGGNVIALALTSTGNLYAAGQFTAMGASGADNIAYWNGTTWANLAADAAINNNVYALAIGPGDVLYVGGVFTDANGIANADGIAKWSGTAWSALSTGAQTLTDVRALAVAPNGVLYAGGQFTTIGGVSVSKIASWNGVGWTSLGTGITTYVDALLFVDNLLYVGGVMSTAGSITIPDGLAIWNGSTWIYTNVDLPGLATVYSLAVGPDNTLYVGYDQAGTATAASSTTINNIGTARTYPTIIIKGPSSGTARVFSILNATTGRGLYFNLTINSGETVTCVLTPDNSSFVSDFAGNVAGSVLPGSNVADFFLAPGDNTVTFLSASSSVTATLSYRPSYLSLDDVN